MNEPYPCKACGETNLRMIHYGNDEYWCTCDTCGCHAPAAKSPLQAAIEWQKANAPTEKEGEA